MLRLDDDFISCQFDDQNASDESGFHDVMGFMDDELKNTSIPKSFQDPDGNQVCLCLPPEYSMPLRPDNPEPQSDQENSSTY